MPIIILEGPDYAGKSTLAETIQEQWLARSTEHNPLTAELLHTGPPGSKPKKMSKDDWADSVMADLLNVVWTKMSLSSTHLVIVDRFHWGAPIYGPIMRPALDYGKQHYGDLGHDRFMRIEMELANRGAITAHVGTTLSELVARSEGREDEYLDENAKDGDSREDQLELLWFRYYQFAANVGQYLPTSLDHPIMVGDYKSEEVVSDLKRLSILNKENLNKNWPDQNRFEYYTYSGIHQASVQEIVTKNTAEYLISQAVDQRIKALHEDRAVRNLMSFWVAEK